MKTNKNCNIKDKIMRFVYTLSLASLLFFFGCDQGSDLTSPVEEFSNQTVNWITLPSPTDMSVNTITFSNSESINGSIGGHVKIVSVFSNLNPCTVKEWNA